MLIIGMALSENRRATNAGGTAGRDECAMNERERIRSSRLLCNRLLSGERRPWRLSERCRPRCCCSHGRGARRRGAAGRTAHLLCGFLETLPRGRLVVLPGRERLNFAVTKRLGARWVRWSGAADDCAGSGGNRCGHCVWRNRRILPSLFHQRKQLRVEATFRSAVSG